MELLHLPLPLCWKGETKPSTLLAPKAQRLHSHTTQRAGTGVTALDPRQLPEMVPYLFPSQPEQRARLGGSVVDGDGDGIPMLSSSVVFGEGNANYNGRG